MMRSRVLLITLTALSVTLREKMSGSFESLSPDAYLKEQIPLISEVTLAKFKEFWLMVACL